MNIVVIKKRTRAIRQLLNKKKVNCLILTKPANVTYTTGFSGDDSWAIVTGRAVYLLTDSRYIEQAAELRGHCRIIQRSGPIAQAAAHLLQKLRSVETAAVEDSTSLGVFKALKRSVKTRLKTAANIVEQLRICKDSGEIAAIRAAANIAARALRQTRRYIKPGLTENELAGMLDFQIRKLRAVNSFDTIVAFGASASRPHHKCGSKKLKKNDTVLIDFGVRYKDYCCDLTRCIAVGRLNAFYKKVYDAVSLAQSVTIKMVKAGVKMQQVDAAARKVIAEHDLPVYGHGTGHGLGLEVHEEPTVSDKAKGRLKAGQVITIEPGVYIPGRLGVRIEDDILVTKTGCEILSRNCPHWPKKDERRQDAN